ncbi:uncharacterized protein [Misgurnus anguillicaudatus]|uniref:uncharacterized protein n=1 Tax=Misgurnus anguillicaudatus TaxID=75329 RepID=UPI003CCF8EE4
MVMKGLQGSRPTSAAVHRKCEPSLCNTSCLSVQLHFRRFLDAGKMAPLSVPNDIHPLLIHLGMPMVSLASLKVSSICPISCPVSSTPRVQLLFSEAFDTVLLFQLPHFRLPQQGHISIIPDKNPDRELCHEQTVVWVTCSEASHEVPHIKANHQITPFAEHDSCSGCSRRRAAVSVHIQERGGATPAISYLLTSPVVMGSSP